MKKTICIAFLVNLLFSCQQENGEKDTTAKDSVSAVSTSEPAALKAFMDSIVRANGGKPVNISINGPGGTEKQPEENNIDPDAPTLKNIDKTELNALIKKSKKKYTLVHCWATWCGPCRKEFPGFLKAVKASAATDVLLVSFDYDSEAQRKKVIAFANAQDANIPLYIVQTQDRSDPMNKQSGLNFIQNYDKQYKGDIPYNILINNKTKQLVKASADYKELMPFLRDL